MPPPRIALAVLLALPAAACEEERITMVQQGMALSAGAPQAWGVRATPCDAPAGAGPFTHTPRPQRSAPAKWSSRAAQDNVAGCAGVRFRIGPDGAARDLDVVTEYPLGYGFGATVRAAIAESAWAPGFDPGWHFLVIVRNPEPFG